MLSSHSISSNIDAESGIANEWKSVVALTPQVGQKQNGGIPDEQDERKSARMIHWEMFARKLIIKLCRFHSTYQLISASSFRIARNFK